MAVALHHPLTNSHLAGTARTAARKAGRPSLGDRVARFFQLWRQRRSDLRAIDTLDERDLHDIGMSRWALRQELARPFWRG